MRENWIDSNRITARRGHRGCQDSDHRERESLTVTAFSLIDLRYSNRTTIGIAETIVTISTREFQVSFTIFNNIPRCSMASNLDTLLFQGLSKRIKKKKSSKIGVIVLQDHHQPTNHFGRIKIAKIFSPSHQTSLLVLFSYF